MVPLARMGVQRSTHTGHNGRSQTKELEYEERKSLSVCCQKKRESRQYSVPFSVIGEVYRVA